MTLNSNIDSFNFNNMSLHDAKPSILQLMELWIMN